MSHRYLNCLPPFDPTHSALAGLHRSAGALRSMLDGFACEYEDALARGRGEAWQAAMVASADLFAHPILHPVDGARP